MIKNRLVRPLMIVLVLVLAVGLVVGACSPSGSDGNTLKVGLITTMSGPAAVLGTPTWQAYSLQQELINEEGGIKAGRKSYMLELVLKDDQLNPETGIAALNELIFKDKVDFLFSGWSNNVNIAFAPIQRKNQILTLSNATNYPLGPEDTWYWLTSDADVWRFAAIATYLSEERPEIKRVAAITPDNAGSRALVDSFRDSIIPMYTNWEFISDVAVYPEGNKEFFPFISKLMADSPDAVFFSLGVPGEFGLFVKQMRENGYDIPILYNAAIDASVIADIAGPANATEIYEPYYDFHMTPEMSELNDLYKERYGDYTSLVPYTCATIPILKGAIEEAKSIDKNKVKEVLESGMAFSGPMGESFFSGMKTFGIDHWLVRPLSVGAIVNGEQTVVATVSADEILRLAGER